MKLIKSTNEVLIFKHGSLIKAIIASIVIIPFFVYLILVIGIASGEMRGRIIGILVLIAGMVLILKSFTKIQEITFDKLKQKFQIINRSLFTLFIPNIVEYNLPEINKIYFERKVRKIRSSESKRKKFMGCCSILCRGTL